MPLRLPPETVVRCHRRFLLWYLLAVVSPASAVVAKHGMVAAEHELAARAGVEMFAQGGNAVDAAIAAAFATGVVNPSSCGIGGGGFLLIRDGKTHRAQVLDFRETAPHAARSDLYVRDGKIDPVLSLRGGLAVAVPGEVRGLARALRDFGTLPLAKVMAPAIRYATDGFPVGVHLAKELRDNADEIRRHASLAAIYLKSTGEPYAVGEVLLQRDLGETLRQVADHGDGIFYAGPIADKIIEATAAEGGILTSADLRGYRERTRQPLRSRYREFTVLGVPPPSSGGGVVLEILNVLSGYDLRAEGPGDPLALHRLAAAEELSFFDRARYYGDPSFVHVPMRWLLSQAHSRELRRRVSRSAALLPPRAAGIAERGGTAHLSAMDDHGTAAALTSTINTPFGSMVVVPGTGIVLNNEMDDFSTAPGVPNVYGLVGSRANSIQPGKRPLSSMSPTLLLRGDAPYLALGGSGGPRIITATVQTIVNVVDFQMDLEKAIAAPRIHHQGLPNRLFFEPALDSTVVTRLRELGHETAEAHDLGSVQAVLVTPAGLVGAADPRKGGAAVGW